MFVHRVSQMEYRSFVRHQGVRIVMMESHGKNNIPIVSWLFLKGKSKCCDYRIPLRYFVLEFLTALLFAFFFVSFGNINDYHYLLTSLIFIPIIMVVIVIDLETMTIPDRFSIGGAIVGLILSFLMPALHGFSNEPLFLERVSALLASLLGMLILFHFVLDRCNR